MKKKVDSIVFRVLLFFFIIGIAVGVIGAPIFGILRLFMGDDTAATIGCTIGAVVGLLFAIFMEVKDDTIDQY